MEKSSIYEDIALRTGGDIYIGVVGPVRTGKSTFIKRFMETQVLPNIENDYMRQRAQDELPQSGSGRTIMTAEPKFVPEEAVTIAVDGTTSVSVRLVDCVGYMVDGALGDTEDGAERMVTTPWFEEEIPMRRAAEIGTRKVIAEHSTIGVAVTTDGSVTDLPREAYLEAEARVVNELKALGKPFALLLNSAHPEAEETQALREELAESYGVDCLAVNCMTLTERDVNEIIRSVLGRFPVGEIGVWLPTWLGALGKDNPLKEQLYAAVRAAAENAVLIRDVPAFAASLAGCGSVTGAEVTGVDMGTGKVAVRVDMPRSLFYETVGEMSGFAIGDDGDLLGLLTELSRIKVEYDKVAGALKDVREKGYGVVMPDIRELTLQEPEIVKKGGKYSVRLKAGAPSIHMIGVDTVTEVSPALGGERSSEDVINFLLQEFEGDTGKIWESNLFGKSLHEIAAEGLQTKIRKMPPEVQTKLRGTIGRIINDGCSGLICIIL